jgi:hypothetical protein
VDRISCYEFYFISGITIYCNFNCGFLVTRISGIIKLIFYTPYSVICRSGMSCRLISSYVVVQLILSSVGLKYMWIVLIYLYIYIYIYITGHGSRAVACFLFARSEAGTVGSNPTQGMDV